MVNSAATYGKKGDLLSPTQVLRECPENYQGPRYPEGSFLFACAHEALKIHWAECCTRSEPCEQAAFQLLATSQHGELAPNAPQAEPEPVAGSSSVNNGSHRASSGNLATEKQVNLVNDLAGVLIRCPGDSQEHGIANIAYRELDSSYAAMTKKRASILLEAMIPMAREIRRARTRGQVRVGTGVKPGVEAGMLYSHDGGIYRATKSQSGRLYAVQVTATRGEDGEVSVTEVYAPGVIGRLKGENRLTLEDAQHFGRRHGYCVCCRRRLTKPESVAFGIGPICRDKHYSA